MSAGDALRGGGAVGRSRAAVARRRHRRGGRQLNMTTRTRPTDPSLLALLKQLSWAEWRQHPWRHAAVLLAVALGVALAFSVQLINASALSEFASAVRSANGEPDL